MAKFCGRCGAKLDQETGLCPNCDARKIQKQRKTAANMSTDPNYIQNQRGQAYSALNTKEEKKQIKKAKKAQKKAEKRGKQAQWSKGKKIRHVVLKLVLILLLLMVVSGGIVGMSVHLGVVNIPFLSDLDQEDSLQTINERNIVVEEKEIIMENETEGTATLVVMLPNYELLFEEAYASEDPNQYLLNALASKDYETQEFEVSANVTVENDQRIVHSDEAVQQLLEKVLVDAIRTQAEVMG